MTRKVADCSKFPSESHCTIAITGEEEEVVRVAVEHAVADHHHKDSPELRQQIRGMLVEEIIPTIPKSGPPPPEGEIFDL
ncbi:MULTISPECIES: DUF1059 domain-containing protein [Streptomyces]|uniref:DUF1059 domain-containing protein n=1 Tax=Streptomyces silvisoli TaxID=3034235 RepID=A0ABT5ZP59_9ACTN|nr:MULTISPECIES: DUF1059 domain-containing protein [Streptomyces]MDF3291369.1 DUF1059 domain-containing protein [Streptomyces silvisoli]